MPCKGVLTLAPLLTVTTDEDKPVLDLSASGGRLAVGKSPGVVAVAADTDAVAGAVVAVAADVDDVVVVAVVVLLTIP